MDDWRISDKRTVLQQSRFLTVEFHRVELPDGHVIPDWSWIITPDFINVVLIDADGRFLFFRQGKYAYDGLSLAPVGGYIEPGEDPLEAAKREVLEETGYQADTWIALGTTAVDANRGCGTAYAYLATGARRVAEPCADDLEPQEMIWLTRDETQAALFANQFKVLPWGNVVAMSLLHLATRS